MEWWPRAKWARRSRPALLGSPSLPPLCVRKCQSTWVCVGHLRSSSWLGLPWAGVEVPGESGLVAVTAAGTAGSSQASRRSRRPRFPWRLHVGAEGPKPSALGFWVPWSPATKLTQPRRDPGPVYPKERAWGEGRGCTRSVQAPAGAW